MKLPFRFFFSTLAAAIALGSAASARDVRIDEASYPYTEVGGWKIESIDKRAGVVGCRASIIRNGRYLAIEQIGRDWNLIVRNPPDGVFAGGIVQIDQRVVDSQFGFSNGYAIKTLDSWSLIYLKAGNTLRVTVNGFAPQTFSLKGSKRAADTVAECFKNGGEHPVASAIANLAHQQPEPQAQQIYPDNRGERNLTCAPYAGVNYPCTAVERLTKPGFQEVFEINPTYRNGAVPIYLFEIYEGGYQAEVWVAFGQEQYQYFGRWDLNEQGPSRCAEPAPNQPADVNARLGQDAWGMCFF